MKRRLIELLLLFFIALTGCGNSDLLTEDEAFIPREELEIEKEVASANEAISESNLSENAYIIDSGMGLCVQSENTAVEEQLTKEELSYTERSIGNAVYLILETWGMKERDDRGLIEHIYYEDSAGSANDFMTIWYLPLQDSLTADETIDRILTYTKSDEYCDRFEFGKITLSTGIEASVYKYHMTDEDYEENGYYIPVGKEAVISIFYDPRQINDESYITEIEKVADSVMIMESEIKDEGADNENRTHNEETIALDSQQNQTVTYDGGHSYYTNVPSDGVAMADAIAQQIASSIISNPAYTTDLERVSAAARAVKGYCDNDQYGQDTTKYYRSPYGVFVAGVYTCAGSTRALGRVLDFMGYSWQHTHENENRHQWCVLTMDGLMGFADGMSGIAGYGALTNGMTLSDGSQIFFAE